MNKQEAKVTENKYIPPHRRRQLDTATSSNTNRNDLPKPSIKPSQVKTTPSNSTRFFTSHALLRQEQRKISSEAINKTIYQGESLQSQQSTTHIDENTQVVLSKNGHVITVQDNKRNTKFDLLNMSKEREKVLLKEVELKNNDYAMCELADIYLSGSLGNRDVQKAHALLLKAAERKNSHAMCLIAQLNEKGDLGAVDLEKAQAWLEKAAEQNNKYALAIVGQRYLQEYLRLNEVNPKAENKQILLQKAMRYLKRSAAKGNTRAMWHIAKIYEEGWQGEKDLAKAIEHYSEAACLGSPNSLQTLQRLVKEQKITPEAFEAILEKASYLIANTSSDLAIDIGLEQIQGKLGTNRQRGFKMLEQAAKKNNEGAIKILAKYYRDGIGCLPDAALSQYWFEQLKKLYEKAIALGNINALWDLGNLYLKGAFGKIDLESAEKLFMSAAEKEDIDSIYYLGTLYIEGQLGDHDPAEGIPWINKAIVMWSEQATKGDIDAAKELINLYLDKLLGFKNYQKAARWLSFLACRGNDQALLNLLSFYLKRKIKLEKDEGNQIFSPDLLNLIKKKAVETEHPKTLWTLAELYREGYLPKEERAENVNPWAKKLENTLAAKGQERAEAALLLGRLYKQSEGLLERNLQQAAKWLCSASCLPTSGISCYKADEVLKAMLNNKEWNESENKQILAGILEYASQTAKKEPYKIGRILGDIYYKGKLTAPNFKEAFHWYNMAADLGNSKAMYRLGIFDQTGLLGTVDFDAAIKWFELAAERGNQKAIKALEKLGKSNELKSELNIQNSSTTEKQNNNAIISRKDPHTMYSLGRQYLLGSEGKTKDPIQAAFWFRKAAQREHIEATFELAQLYDSSQLGKKVRPVAINFFKLAAKRNHLAAISALIDIYSQGILIKASSQQVVKWQAREKRLQK